MGIEAYNYCSAVIITTTTAAAAVPTTTKYSEHLPISRKHSAPSAESIQPHQQKAFSPITLCATARFHNDRCGSCGCTALDMPE